MKRIAIQGELGSFHDIAAHQYFEGEQIQIICCSTFEQVFENIKRDPTCIGMTAIENTIAGSLLHNYELEDTAGAAEAISRNVCRGQAAICNSSAARLYGLKVLENQIEDNKHNFTRFLVVTNPRKADFLRSLEQSDKASLVFSLPHEEGSLSQAIMPLTKELKVLGEYQDGKQSN